MSGYASQLKLFLLMNELFSESKTVEPFKKRRLSGKTEKSNVLKRPLLLLFLWEEIVSTDDYV